MSHIKARYRYVNSRNQELILSHTIGPIHDAIDEGEIIANGILTEWDDHERRYVEVDMPKRRTCSQDEPG